MTEEEMKKAGGIARSAKAKEAESTTPLSAMLGQPETVELWGKAFQVYPVSLGCLKRFSAAMQALGDLGLFALVEGQPDVIARLNKVMGRTDDGATLDVGDAAAGLRLMLLQPEPAQVEAMIDVVDIALNRQAVTFTDGPIDTMRYHPQIDRETIEALITPMEFVTVYRACVTLSGLNP